MKQLKIYKSPNEIIFKINSNKLKMDKYFSYSFKDNYIRFFKLHKTDFYYSEFEELDKFEILFDKNQKQLLKEIFTNIYLQSIYINGYAIKNIKSGAYTSDKCLVPLSREFYKLILREFPELELQKNINKRW